MNKMFRIIATALFSLVIVSAQAKTFKLALDADPVSLDPHEQLSGATLEMSHWVFDPLIRWDQNLGFEPRLAEKWERIDDLTMRFYLRKGVTFHSGNPFTAKDVVWTMNRIKNSADFKAIFESFSEVKVVDDYTIRMSSPWTVSSIQALMKMAKTKVSSSNMVMLLPPVMPLARVRLP